MGGGLGESFVLVFSGLTDFSLSFPFSFSSSFFSSFSFLTSLSLSLLFSFFSLPTVSARGDPERERDDRELKLAERDRDDADAERDRRRGDGDRRDFRRGDRERDLETTISCFSYKYNANQSKSLLSFEGIIKPWGDWAQAFKTRIFRII